MQQIGRVLDFSSSSIREFPRIRIFVDYDLIDRCVNLSISMRVDANSNIYSVAARLSDMEISYGREIILESVFRGLFQIVSSHSNELDYEDAARLGVSLRDLIYRSGVTGDTQIGDSRIYTSIIDNADELARLSCQLDIYIQRIKEHARHVGFKNVIPDESGLWIRTIVCNLPANNAPFTEELDRENRAAVENINRHTIGPDAVYRRVYEEELHTFTTDFQNFQIFGYDAVVAPVRIPSSHVRINAEAETRAKNLLETVFPEWVGAKEYKIKSKKNKNILYKVNPNTGKIDVYRIPWVGNPVYLGHLCIIPALTSPVPKYDFILQKCLLLMKDELSIWKTAYFHGSRNAYVNEMGGRYY